MSCGSQGSYGDTDRWAYPRGSDKLAAESRSNLQQPTYVSENNRGANVDMDENVRPKLDRINQLTDAVENLGPLLESFRDEHTLREQTIQHLLDENDMLRAEVRQNIFENGSRTATELLNENTALKEQIHNKDVLLKEKQEKLKQLLSEKDSIRAQLTEMQNYGNMAATNANLLSENDSLKTDLEEKTKLIQTNESTYNTLYTENATLKSKIKSLEKERHRCKTNMDDYKSRLEEMRKKEVNLLQEIRDLMVQRDDCRHINEALQKNKKKLEDEVAESKKRLSRMMGNKLSDNNPDIADLSDKNRPTKLAEKYAELYDNQWTDAFEIVVEGSDEIKGIKFLLTLLQDMNSFCCNMSDAHTAQIKTAVLMTYNPKKQPSEYFSKQLKDFRRATAEEAAETVLELYMAKLQGKDTSAYQLVQRKKVQPFIRECLELCWMMSVQDPPVVFGKQEKQDKVEEFDTTVYKPYTQTGAYFDYLVWPPLYLHENGPLLAKGVAQARGNKLPNEITSKLDSLLRVSAGPGTAVPVGSTVNDRMASTPSQEMSRSFNLKSSGVNKNSFSRTTYGASGYYDNNFSSTVPQSGDQSFDRSASSFGQVVAPADMAVHENDLGDTPV